MPFSQRILRWHERHGRKDLPWQVADPYAVWVSEIMLQQTQVMKVLEYYARFMARFPTVQSLAQANEDDVLALWSGLGYYNRARHLHRAARRCLSEHGGALPITLEELMALPGIGRSTAGAILSLTRQKRAPILDGNVKRLFARHFEVEGDTNRSATLKALWKLAEANLPERDFDRYNQALMDLGASVCTRHSPCCGQCPVKSSCGAYRHGRTAELPQKKRSIEQRLLPLFPVVVTRPGAAGREVLVQHRDASGIWPKLWFVPTFDSHSERTQWLAENACPAGEELAPFDHVLSHRRLRLQGQHVALDTTAESTSTPISLPHGGLENPLRWVAIDALDEVAHPRALNKLLAAIS